MSYYGVVEVEVRLLRQGHGADSSGEPGSGVTIIRTDADAFGEMRERWDRAQLRMTPEKMRAALEVLER